MSVRILLGKVSVRSNIGLARFVSPKFDLQFERKVLQTRLLVRSLRAQIRNGEIKERNDP